MKTLFPVYQILPLIIFIEGFVSISVEILVIRQLLPVAGSSVIVTSLIIGFFLLFLALGYHKGGKIYTNWLGSLRYNFFISAIWLGIGLSYLFILFFFSYASKIIGDNLFYPLMIYLLLIISPMIYTLGQTLPVTMHMTKQNKLPGTIGGNTLGLSTIGSFLGAIITTLVFMNFLGVAWTILINFTLLLVLSLLLSETKKSFLLGLSVALFAFMMIYFLNIQVEKRFFILTDHYANYQILHDKNSPLNKNEKMLLINDSFSSFTNGERQGFLYIETIKKILFHDLKLRDSNILVLGAGGFTLSAENGYGNHFTYVDIDKKITDAVIPHFIPKLNDTFIADDARHYVHTTTHQFQAIIVDAYSNTRTIPAHLLTHEYFVELQKKLTNKGVIIFNMIAKPSLDNAYSKHLDNTIRHTFKNCMVNPLTHENKLTNILYVCHNSTNQNDNKMYSDNLNTATLDAFDWQKK